MKNSIANAVFGFSMMAGLFSCVKNTKPDNSDDLSGKVSVAASGGTQFFYSGFEVGTVQGGGANTNYPRITAVANPNLDELRGNSGYGVANSDWLYFLEVAHASKFDSCRLNYESGTVSDRFAEIVNNPYTTGNPSAKVMHFQINNAVIYSPCTNNPKKGRVQFEIQAIDKVNPNTVKFLATGLTQYYQKVKFFLPADFNALTKSGALGGRSTCDFLGLFEYHDKTPVTPAHNNSENDFRMGIGLEKDLSKPIAGGDLYFGFRGDDFPADSPVFGYTSTKFKVPIGVWVETELYIKEGTAANKKGRLYFRAKKVSDANWTTVTDTLIQTINTANTNPSGMTDWSPMKFYCSGKVAEAFKTGDPDHPEYRMQIYWDDVEIWENRIP